MGLRIKIDPIEKVTAASILADLTLQQQKKAAADYAQQGIDEADQINKSILGRVPPKTTTVDGRKGAPLESVNPAGGTIVVEYELVVDVLRWIAKTLIERSPEVSGAYKRGHTLFADGQEVRVGDNIQKADEYAFTNLVPYARKIEIGKTKSGRSFVIQVENRIYERTARDARARFGNMAKIEFTYRGIVGGLQINPRSAKSRAHNKASLRYPTIIVTSRAS